MMRILTLLLLCCFGTFVLAEEEGRPRTSRPVSRFPDGSELLEQMRARLPRMPLRLEAELRATRRGRVIERRLATIEVDWGAPVPTGIYTIRDAFGANLERVIVTWQDQNTTYAYFKGPDLEPQEEFDPNWRIDPLDLTWGDLTLSYLWLREGRTVAYEGHRTRRCYVVEVPVENDPEVSMIKLWIDAQERFVMDARTYDADGDQLKHIKGSKIKKIEEAELWMVTNFDVRHGSGRKTKIVVESLQRLDLIEDEEGNEVLPEPIDLDG